jgi:dTDP-4-amino-4,6-dideoxygalactose transaminase
VHQAILSRAHPSSSSEALLPANPKASYLAYKEEIDAAIANVLESGTYILGSEVEEFEAEFARYIGVESAIAVGSGTDALEIALRACGVAGDDAVITVSHTAVATVCAIQLCGASPVLVDVDPGTFTIDLNLVEDTLRSDLGDSIKAIVPVHLYGHAVDMPAIMEIAERHDLWVVEDCAQAHGSAWDRQKVGSFGDFGAFSFYPTKNLGALGDGGGLVTKDTNLAGRARMLRQYGWKQRYVSELFGMNSRLDELQAAILRVKLRHLDQGNVRRRKIAQSYDAGLGDAGLILPLASGSAEHVYHQYVVRSESRDELRAFLQKNSVGTAVLYPLPVHLQNAYRENVTVGRGGLRHTERVCKEILSLPLFPELRDDQVARVVDLLNTPNVS